MLPTSSSPSAPSSGWRALGRQLCCALCSATHAMTRADQPVLAPPGLTCPHGLVMRVLWEQDGLTATQLRERPALDSGTLAPLLRRQVAMTIQVPGMDRTALEALVATAYEVCPYSNATRGNVDQTLTIA